MGMIKRAARLWYCLSSWAIGSTTMAASIYLHLGFVPEALTLNSNPAPDRASL